MGTLITGALTRDTINDRFAKSGHPLNGCPIAALDPISSFSGYQVFSTDFADYTGPATAGTAGGWVAAETGTSVIGLELSSQFGSLQIQTAGTENDAVVLQKDDESFRYVVGKRLWCFARLNVSDANDAEALFGLAITTADPLGGTLPTDGIFFEKAETATEWDTHVRKDGASTESTLVTSTFADGTYRVLGFVVSANGDVNFYEGSTFDNLDVIATVAAGNANLPTDEDLALSFALETGANAAKDITVDWVFCAQER